MDDQEFWNEVLKELANADQPLPESSVFDPLRLAELLREIPVEIIDGDDPFLDRLLADIQQSEQPIEDDPLTEEILLEIPSLPPP